MLGGLWVEGAVLGLESAKLGGNDVSRVDGRKCDGEATAERRSGGLESYCVALSRHRPCRRCKDYVVNSVV